MMFVKLSRTEDGAIKAETARRVLGYFEDMDEQDLRAYLVHQAELVGETIQFVDEFEEHEERVDFGRLMKRRFHK